MAYTRWDPKSRAGAVAVRSQARHDVRAVEALSENVTDWAKYQNLAGETDNVETSPITGTYDWRSYIQEEAQLAQRREAKPRDKKAPIERVEPAAPSVFYA